MKTTVTIPVLLLLTLACGEDTFERADARAPRLEATLIGGVPDEDGRLYMAVPFRGPVPLLLRVTNTGDAPVQVVRSSFPFFYFHKLTIFRIEEDGARIPVKPYFDLYPTKDMMPPTKEYVTLEPGEHMDRHLDVLIREAYGLSTFCDGDIFGNRDRLLGEDFGMLRTPGVYEFTGVYSPEPTFLDGKPHDIFSAERGRDESIPLWNGGEVRSESVKVVIEIAR